MNRAVWKFPLALTAETQQVAMPVGARVVHVAAQDRVPTVWAEVEVPAEGQPTTMMMRMFRIVGTGARVPDRFEHRGVAFLDPYVFHVYEGRP